MDIYQTNILLLFECSLRTSGITIINGVLSTKNKSYFRVEQKEQIFHNDTDDHLIVVSVAQLLKYLKIA